MNNIWAQAQIIGYSQIREYEDNTEHENILKASGAKLI